MDSKLIFAAESRNPHQFQTLTPKTLRISPF
jgi:hypothetical protein